MKLSARRSMFRTTYLVPALCVCVSLWSGPSMAEESVKESDWAHAQFNKAYRENDKRNYAEALKILKEVWAKFRTYDVASELSRSEGALGHHAAGAKYTAYAIAHVPPREGSEFKNSHAARLAFSLPHIYSAKLQVTPADLIVSVDGVPLDVPVEIGLYLEPGPHRVEFKRSGYVTETREIDAKAGVQESLVVELKKEATADGDAIPTTNVQPKPASSAVQPLPPESPVEAPRSSGNATLAWTVLGVGSGLTAIAVGTGVYFHVKGADSQDKADKLSRSMGSLDCVDPSRDCSQLDSFLADRSQGYSRAQVLYGVGAGLAIITGAATWYLWPRASSGSEASKVSAWVTPSSAGVATFGRF